jgi:hypothetical protein
MATGVFSVNGSIDAELRRFKELAKDEPLRSKQIYANGEKLITLAATGEYAQFKRFAVGVEKEDLMTYFVAKALMASLVGGHLMLSSFILDNGYPLHLEKGVPNLLHDCLRELSDYECVSVVALLASKGVDVNKQEKETWLAPIHIAVTQQLSETVRALADAGADVNSVAGDDSMPLSLAHKLPSGRSTDSSYEKDAIIKLLVERGARSSWRRDQAGAMGTSSTHNTFDTSSFSSNTQVKVGESTTCAPTNPSTGTAGNAKSGNRVRFNGSQLASLSTEPAAPTAPIPVPKPRVTVTTSDGSRLLPPPRIPKSAPTAATSTSTTSTSTTTSISTSTSTASASTLPPPAPLEPIPGIETAESEGLAAGLLAALKSFQLSDDGGMIFSTGDDDA